MPHDKWRQICNLSKIAESSLFHSNTLGHLVGRDEQMKVAKTPEGKL